ncbi:alpha-amylase family glycosyl hydrolase [Flavobacteriaceae bacterium]|nr:alpha-amylase family glycosyl hydrolase [Flavobacteriaceae bacterium]
MKKTVFFLLQLIIIVSINAQVTFSGSAIEVDESVTFTVDVNATTTCNGFSSPTKVYMHAGIGDNSNAFGFNVIGNWGQDDGVGEMTSNGDGTYSITITPKDYFGLTQAQIDTATQIGMVFRNEDGSQELKLNDNASCEDFIFPIGAVQINIISPSTRYVIVNSGDNLNVISTINFQGNTTVQGSIEVFYNNVFVTSNTCGFPNCSATIPNITESGEVKIVGTPPGSSENGEAKFNVIIAPTVTEQTMPSGLIDGINYTSDATKATLVLNAPGKDFIEVSGSFNNYTPTSTYLMKKDPGTGKFWLELTNLTSGQIETYQYWVYDGSPIANSPSLVKTADPFSALVLSPSDDPLIPSSTYPNIPTYPSGQDREVTVLQTGQTPYSWVVPNFQAPKEEDLIIYEVLVRDFDENRNYQDLIDRIDYFKNLNINAIELMPIMEFDGNETWGYNTSYHYALDKFYGSQNKFKEFVDLCHQNGIAVILDLALNHATGRNPLVRMWMDDPNNDGWGEVSSENPYFNTVAKHSYSVFSDFNHQSALTQEYTQRVIKHWIDEYNIDGFRWDLTKGFTQNCEKDEVCTNSYQQDRVDILKQYADYSWSIDPDHYVIFEHLGGQQEQKEWADYRIDEGKGIMLWGKSTNPYNQLTMGYGSNSDFSGIGHNSQNFIGKRLIGYTESHDEERLMFNNLQNGSSNGNYDITDLDTALERMGALGAVSLTIPGPKMIWHFGELGMEQSLYTCFDGTFDNCRLDTKPQPQWENNWLNDPIRSEIYNNWARLNELKINEAVFEGNYDINSGSLTPKIYIWDDALPSNSLKNVIILANFDLSNQDVVPYFPYTGVWYDLMDESGDSSLSVLNTNQAVSLAPGEFKVFGNQPASTLNTNDLISENNIVIYPNPANDFFKINQPSTLIKAYNILGREVLSYEGKFSSESNFNISTLESGIYLISVWSERGKKTYKLIKN